MEGINAQPLSKFLASQGIGEVLPPDLLDSLDQLVGKIEETKGLNLHFIELSEAQISSLSDPNKTIFYEANATQLREEFKWYPNILYSMGLALDGCNKEALGILEKLCSGHYSLLLLMLIRCVCNRSSVLLFPIRSSSCFPTC